MIKIQELIQQEFIQAQSVLENFINYPENFKKIEEIVNVVCNAIQTGHKIIAFGNGGSHCDAMHFAEELTGRYRTNRAALPAIAISNPSHLSCVGNDYGFEFVFSRFIEALGQKGDVAFGISTSGQSKNILEAFKVAKSKGLTTVLLTGKSANRLETYADHILTVPHDGYADRIQEIHIKIIHAIILSIEQKLLK